jgi:hypothetical protein
MKIKKTIIYSEENPKSEDLEKIFNHLGLTYDENMIIRKTVKSKNNSSFVDILIDKNDEIFLCEITQTNEKSSRNGNYQRPQKFVQSSHYYPNSKKMIYVKGGYIVKTDSSKIAASLYYLNNIICNYTEDSEKFPTTLKDLIELQNSVSGPSHNTPIKLKLIDGILNIQIKLEKDHKLSYDPNIGYLSSIATIPNSGIKEVIVTKHGLDKNIVKKHKGKLYKNLQLMGIKATFVFDDESITWEVDPNFKMKDKYYVEIIDGEKVAMINFENDFLKNKKHIDILFKNYAGCEREKFIDFNGNEYTVPKKIQIPDQVLYNKNKNILLFIEAENIGNTQNGLKQLNTFDEFENWVRNVLKFDNEIIRGVITDYYNTHCNNQNYLGNYLNKNEFKLNEILY